jgi:hypothetical protein
VHLHVVPSKVFHRIIVPVALSVRGATGENQQNKGKSAQTSHSSHPVSLVRTIPTRDITCFIFGIKSNSIGTVLYSWSPTSYPHRSLRFLYSKRKPPHAMTRIYQMHARRQARNRILLQFDAVRNLLCPSTRQREAFLDQSAKCQRNKIPSRTPTNPASAMGDARSKEFKLVALA